MGSFRGFQIQEGDTIILSAKFIPGNERSISNMMNAVLRKGATIVHHKLADIHVSGHASQEEQKLMIELTRPRFFVPVHGEVRQMTVHRDLAVECGVPKENTRIIEDGQTLEFGKDGMRAGEPVPAGRVFVDGKGVGDVGPAILRDRMHLSNDGMVICVLVVNRQTGDLAGGPDLFMRGVMLEEKGGALLDRARKAALEAYEALEPEEKADFAEVETEVRRALKKVFDQALDRRPMIIPIAMEM
ncbi:MAG: ribonuclease J, partial [Candidatus Methylomirabilis sp.]|nr:ribonuclease J [Deltaproteobacteria bacterium]